MPEDPAAIRVCFCDLADDVDRSDPDSHEPGCIGAVMLSMQRACEATPYKWTPMRNWMRDHA